MVPGFRGADPFDLMHFRRTVHLLVLDRGEHPKRAVPAAAVVEDLDVFALRIYDATGMEFLRNYIGDAYADVLSALADRTAVVFGRASSCPSPVIIRINDHQEMIAGFWDSVREAIPTPAGEHDAYIRQEGDGHGGSDD